MVNRRLDAPSGWGPDLSSRLLRADAETTHQPPTPAGVDQDDAAALDDQLVPLLAQYDEILRDGGSGGVPSTSAPVTETRRAARLESYRELVELLALLGTLNRPRCSWN